ncbi:MAG: deoxyribodipyrimidine photo-lyase [Acidobacteriia bacterium]|nr:deoxyribodipyrimidine photo-lyase [Terriglobia bacterium]
MLRLDPTLQARITVRHGIDPDPDGKCVVYWMQRAQRAMNNPALDAAIEVANSLRKPIVVFLGLIPFYPHANLRHYQFLVEGLHDLAAGLMARKVGFVFRRYPDHRLEKFCKEVRPAIVIGDENPLREPESWRRKVAKHLHMPLWTVDADVVVPSSLLAKEQYAARTIRPRIHAQLARFLTMAPDRKAHVPWSPTRRPHPIPSTQEILSGIPLDRTVAPVGGFKGGTAEAVSKLKRFIRDRLNGYSERRNNPGLQGTSQLSPYLHFGHIGPVTVAVEILKADAPQCDREAFLEELIVRRELAINYVRFNPRYDHLEGCEPWALRSLKTHAPDHRQHRYTERQLENAETHDPLWNAAQKQMVLTGWMHGYMRMYWAKKILEWSGSPGAAFEVAVRLNDRYELDGRDPNGYAGIAWAIGGKHDRAWGPERPVFGKIRYMSYESTSRKFDSRQYIASIIGLERGQLR